MGWETKLQLPGKKRWFYGWEWEKGTYNSEDTMIKKHALAGLTLLLAVSLLLGACSAQPPVVPTATVDANAIYTQAAATVQAGIAQTEAARPTTAPTQTPAPTNTVVDPTLAAGLTATAKAVLQPPSGPTATLAPGMPTATKAFALPTATLKVVAPAPAKTGDKAELSGQSPSDGTSIPKSASFDMNIVLKNVGTTTWSTRYALVYYAGDQLGSPNDFNMPHEVKPGETVKLVFPMTTPDSTGKKKIIWAVRNADGVNFYDLWLEINVTD
jgi:hypothetical protein